MPSIVPNVIFRTRVRDDSIQPNPFTWKDLTTQEVFEKRKIVLFAIPGAFTPTCSSQHFPRYDELYDQFKAVGIDEVICLSVNDAFVMFKWGNHIERKNVFMLPDGNGDFTRKMGMLVEKANRGLGYRSWRYSMCVEDMRITKMFVEEGFSDNCNLSPYKVSDADTMLSWLQGRTRVEAPPMAKPYVG